jgi:hypothetical protein
LSPLFGIWVVVSTNTTVWWPISYFLKIFEKTLRKTLFSRKTATIPKIIYLFPLNNPKIWTNPSRFLKTVACSPKFSVFRQIFRKFFAKKYYKLSLSKQKPKYQISGLRTLKSFDARKIRPSWSVDCWRWNDTPDKLFCVFFFEPKSTDFSQVATGTFSI